MCGIAGCLSHDGRASKELIGRMTASLDHRGPDESGIYLDGRMALGHARLGIIDLEGGAQPIANEDETLWIVYNGEVFNYPELREGLLASGHRFSTATDTEVVLHLYEERGPACLDELNGQFAFAIWDSLRGELFLARDRVGIVPLYYAERPGAFLFASEIKAILQDPQVSRGLDPRALAQVLTFWTPLPGRTVFGAVKELPPGHWMKVARGRTELRRWWDFDFAPRGEELDWPLEKVASEALSILTDAARIRLRADVPVGCYLSGGLDSSGIATLISTGFPNDLRTFGIGFEDAAFDEGEHQRLVADSLGTRHTGIRISNAEIAEGFARAVRHAETPLLRTAPVPLQILSAETRNSGYKVALTGEGSDEIFGGYNIFREAKIRRFWARRPESELRAALAGELYPYLRGGGAARRMFFAAALSEPDDPFFSHRTRWRNTGGIRRLMTASALAETRPEEDMAELAASLPEAFKRWDYLARAQYLEMKIFLPAYLLSSQGDRMAMSNSLELRVPYLDHRLIEFLGRVPSRMKLRGLNEKHVLKKALGGMLPPSVLNRPKQPYRAPATDLLMARYEDLLDDRSVAQCGLFDSAKVRAALARPHGEREGMALAAVISTQILWHEMSEAMPYAPDWPKSPCIVHDRRGVAGHPAA